MRLRKKGIALLVLTMLVVSVVGALSSAHGKTVLRYYTWDDATGVKFINEVVDLFMEEHPDVEVKVESASYGDYWQKLQTMIAGGTAPDVFQINPDFLAVFAERNALANLNQFIAEDSDFELQDYFSEVIDLHMINDNLYVLPRDVAPSVLFYNETMFREAGLKTPYEYYEDDEWTWETFLTVSQRLTKPEIHQYGVTFETMWHRALQWVWQNGGEAFDSVDSPTKCLLDSEAAAGGYQFAADLINVYHVSPSPRLTRSQSSTELFITGKVAMDINGAWMIPSYKNIDAFEWDVAPLPKGVAWGDVTGGSGPAVYSKTKHSELAWELAKALAGPRTQTLFAEAGYIVPTIKDVFYSASFMDGTGRLAHRDVFLEVQKYAKVPVLTGRYMEIDNLIQKELDLVWLGAKTAKEALTEVVPKIDKVLAK
jgi:multiple sugar transport system substrate-binding protein